MKARTFRRHLLLIAILAGLLVAGGVLAQEIIEFFTQGEDDISTRVYSGIETDEIKPPTEFSSVEEGVLQANYNVWIPTYIPEGYTFLSGAYSEEHQSTRFVYNCEIAPWQFSILQSPATPESLSFFSSSEVGASATIEPVQIRVRMGEYLRGEWLVPAMQAPNPQLVNEDGTPIPQTAVWTNESEWQRLRWVENGLLFSIGTHAARTNTIAPEPCALNKEDYVEIANGLQPLSTRQSTPTPTPNPIPNYTDNLDNLVEQAPFEVWLPSYIPPAYIFEGGNSAEIFVTQYFTCENEDTWGFMISQNRITADEALRYEQEVGASAIIETVNVGDFTGQYVRGNWFTPMDRPEQVNESGEAEITAEWVNNTEWQRLVWYDGEFLFTVQTSSGVTWVRSHTGITYSPTQANNGCTLDKEDYVAIANSLQRANSLDQ